MLIEDTVNFEQQYHMDRIARGRIDVARARSWYHAPAWRNDQQHETSMERELFLRPDTTKFLDALLYTLLSPACTPFPDTFKLDAERLRSIRSDIYDLFCLDACELVFTQVAGRRALSHSQKNTLRFVISSVVHQSPYGSSWEDNIENIAAETVRQLSNLPDGELPPSQEAQLRTKTEQLLRQIFSDPSRFYFAAKAEAAQQHLLPIVQADLEQFNRASLVEVFNSYLPSPKALAHQKLRPTQPHDSSSVLADVGRRIAHVAILHWRIWSPIVYLNGPEPVILPNRQPTAHSMSRSSTLRDSPAPAQFLASNAPDSSDHIDGAAMPPEVDVDASAPDGTEQIPRTVANTDAQAAVDDPSSPILYRQRTN